MVNVAELSKKCTAATKSKNKAQKIHREAHEEKTREQQEKWENCYKANRLDKLKQLRQTVLNK